MHEPPPRSSDRLADRPAGGPGIAAGYRAVSQAGDASHPPGARWPTPSPAPPARAHRPQDSEHTYARPQEPPLFASPLRTPSPYGIPAYGTADATPSYGSGPGGGTSMPDTPVANTPTPSYEASYETPYRAAPAAEPHHTTVPGTGAEPPAGPFSAPPAGEPWHAPAGDRP
ncbi:hypothetical protein [Streptomyces sp. NPDC088755]|uniref:hypothetical protein n=1 Tax=Streptomyces sp. NPDC088755 TaxID=3365888 RepID=UPI0037F1DD5F